MKTRIIQTRFWDDDFISEADLETQHLYLYLLTSQYINISGMFQLAPNKICFEAKLTTKQFDHAKNNLQKNKKTLFYKGWVYVVNAKKNNNYTKSEDNQKAYERELLKVPEEVRTYFDSTLNGSEDSTVGVLPTVTINNKQEIINNKLEKEGIVKGNQEIQKYDITVLKKRVSKLEDITPAHLEEIAQLYNVPLEFVQSKLEDIENYTQSTGKKYKDYLATLRNWVKKDALKLKIDIYKNKPKSKGNFYDF